MQSLRKTGPSSIPRILVADDQPDVLEALRLLLSRNGYGVETVASPRAVFAALKHSRFDLLLLDLNYARDTTSGREGLELIGLLKTLPSAPAVVVMTGWGTIPLAVEAMQRGAGDFIEKPWENERLLAILRRQIEQDRARHKIERSEAEIKIATRKLALEFRKREGEMEEARRVQQGFLPKLIPQLEGYQIAGAWQPARTVSGDYFDVLKFSDQALALCIADVAGKGMPAALLMSNLQATIRGLASEYTPPGELCEHANQLLGRNVVVERFVTLFYGLLDARRKCLRYANAGHNAPILLRPDGSLLRLREGGPVLGISSDRHYEQGEVCLSPGDRLLLFTDGVTEARSRRGEEFGEQHLIQLLERNQRLSAASLREVVLTAVGEFCGGHFEDDATLLVIAVN